MDRPIMELDTRSGNAMSNIGARLVRVARLAPENALLLFLSLLSTVPRLYYSAIEPIEYDGYWHVFIAMQQDWGDFQREYQANFHPPLFYNFKAH